MRSAAVLAVFACIAVAAAVDMPQGIRLAFSGTGSNMAVSWTTNDFTSPPTVKVGTNPNGLNSVFTGSSSNYSVGFVFHDVVLTGLAESTVYYYTCGSDSGGYSSVFSFTSLSSTRTQFTVAVYGDMGISNSEATTARLIEQLNMYDFVLHVGDFSYADDRISGYDETWNQWQAQVEPITSGKAYMVCPGNHEASCHSIGDILCADNLNNFTAYNHRFRMPWKESGATGLNMWHSFNYGNAHFIMIDTETDIGPDSPEGPNTLWKSGGFGDQITWLQNDLKQAAANRDAVPWIIVGGHRPMYSTAAQTLDNIVWPNTTLHLREQVESMFYSYGVDLYLCGHVHGYERMWPVYQNVTQQKNYNNPSVFTHLIVGSAGNIEGGEHWGADTDWLAFKSSDFGFAKLSVLNSTTATWEYIRAADGAVLDEFILTRNRS